MSSDILIRNSEISCYKECRLKWWWAYVQRLESINARGPLALGTLVHGALELWYPKGRKRGAKKLAPLAGKAFKQLVASGELPGDVMHAPVTGSGGEEIHIVDLAQAMLQNYQDKYGTDDHLEVVAPEMNFAVSVLDARERVRGTAVGQIDLTVFDHNVKRFGFLEHKTGANLEPFGAPVELDEQNAHYWTYGPIYLEWLGVIDSQDMITFLRYNRLAKNISVDERPKDEQGRSLNKDGSVSKQQPAEKFLRETVYRTVHQRRALDKRFASVAKEMDLARRKKLPIYKSPGRHCGYCEFRETCEVHEADEDFRAVLRATTRRWDPYAAYTETEVNIRG